MSIGSVRSRMVSLDNFFDYVPVFSTITNIVDLFQKCLVLPFMDKKNIADSHYFTHIDQKSAGRCALLLIPVIGNLAAIFFDLASLKNTEDKSIGPNQSSFYDFHRKAFNKNEARDQRWEYRRDRARSEGSPDIHEARFPHSPKAGVKVK